MLLVCFQSCTSSNNCNTSATKSDTIKIDEIKLCKLEPEHFKTRWIPSLILKEKNNPRFPIKLIETHGKLFFSYVSNSSYLILASLLDSNEIYRIPISYYTSMSHHFLMDIIKDTIHLLDVKQKEYYQIELKDNFSLGNKKTFNLNNIGIDNDIYILTKTSGTQLNFIFPNLLIPYGKTQNKNYLDDRGLLKIDLSTNQFSKVIEFPEWYQSCNIYSERINFDLKDNYIYATFTNSGKIIKLNLDNNKIQFNSIPGSSSFRPFKKELEKNLAYVRQYEETIEKNSELLTLSGGGYVIVKKLPRESISEKIKVRVYLFDKENKIQCYNLFEGESIPFILKKYQSGFVILDVTLSNLLYYEVSN